MYNMREVLIPHLGSKKPIYSPKVINEKYDSALTLKSEEGILCLPPKYRAQCFYHKALLAKSMERYNYADNLCQEALNFDELLPSLKKEIENLQSTMAKIKKERRERKKQREFKTDFYLS